MSSDPESGLAPLPRTTDGAIAVSNMDAMVSGHVRRVESAPGDIALRAGLVELLLTRGQFLGTLRDWERATEIADALVREAPKNPAALRARASTNATWHKFDAALADLDAAEQAGAPARELARTRASALAALGRFDDASRVAPNDGDSSGDAMALASRALLDAERGRFVDAEHGLQAARGRYRDVSPFPLAWMDAMQAALYERRGDRAKARAHYTRAVRLVPAYARAAAHLATLETPLRAVALLSPIAARSDDPEIDAELGDAHRRLGHVEASATSVARARERYESLMTRHSEAFADHAARFYLGVGGEPTRALPLARQNAALRRTDEAGALWLEAAQAARDTGATCEAARSVLGLPYVADAIGRAARSAEHGAHCAEGGRAP